MDDVQRAYYNVCFQRDFHAKKDTEFQRWFVRLATHAYGADFQSVRASGPYGDFKADGLRISTGTVFQCYGPQGMKVSALSDKIRNDFSGARAHWPDMKAWVLVLNTNEGLPAPSTQLLDKLREENEEIHIGVWMEVHLRELVQELDLDAHESLFGYAPSVSGISTLALDDIIPIIDDLVQAEPTAGEEPLLPPSVQKLQRNSLSHDATELLRIGRRKEHLVSKYFASTIRVEIGERIAEAFRRRYANLKEQGHSPDLIFGHLQAYAGATNEPRRLSASLAVISYFFERCDIFEDPAYEAGEQ